MSEREKQPTQEQGFEGMPIRITIEAGPGVLGAGTVLGKASLTFGHDVGKHGLCPHHVTLEVMSFTQTLVMAALVQAVEQSKAETAAEEGSQSARNDLDA